MTGDNAIVDEVRQELTALAPPTLERLERCLDSARTVMVR